MKAPPDSYDVVIVGGGPAGSAAAIAASRKKLRALVIEQGDRPRPGLCAGWLGPAAMRLCRDGGVEAKSVGVAFTGLRLRSWDLKRCVEITDRELCGCIVHGPALSAALLAAARAAGTHVLPRTTVLEVCLGEADVTLRLSDGQAVAGQVVLVADGAASPTARMIQVAASREVPSASACAYAVCETKIPDPGLDVVLGTGRALRLAAIARSPTQVRVLLFTHDASASPTSELADFLKMAKAAGVLPDDFDGLPVETRCLAGTALEMESHVSKRCLLIGDAGGFVATFSHEGIYPAMRSAGLAIETVARALRAPVLQDELASFSAAWRAALADYLRMPNTDLGLLMPMVFNNAQMSKRVARAFLLGQAF